MSAWQSATTPSKSKPQWSATCGKSKEGNRGREGKFGHPSAARAASHCRVGFRPSPPKASSTFMNRLRKRLEGSKISRSHRAVGVKPHTKNVRACSSPTVKVPGKVALVSGLSFGRRPLSEAATEADDFFLTGVLYQFHSGGACRSSSKEQHFHTMSSRQLADGKWRGARFRAGNQTQPMPVAACEKNNSHSGFRGSRQAN